MPNIYHSPIRAHYMEHRGANECAIIYLMALTDNQGLHYVSNYHYNQNVDKEKKSPVVIPISILILRVITVVIFP